jgi:hypothetical protein
MPSIPSIRDLERQYLLDQLGLSGLGLTIADLRQLFYSNPPTGGGGGGVASVNGDTGPAVTITKSTVGLANVDNTSDANKPVSTAQQTALNLKAPLASPTFTGTVSGVTKTHVGLGNVDNTADTAKPVSTAQQTALNLKADASAVTTALAAKADDAATTSALAAKAPLASPTFTGTVTVPAPSNNTDAATKLYVDTVAVGGGGGVVDADATTKGKIQLAGDLSGTAAAPTVPGLGGKEPSIASGTTGQYWRGDKSWQTLNKTAVGLANVDNTADTAKPVSTAQQTALDLKAPLASPTFTGTVAGVTKAHVGLGNVDNTADTAKPVSTAQQTALNLKADLASPTFTGTVAGITKTMVGLGSVDNTADTAKPVSTAQQTALNLKANIASPTFTGTVGGITKSMVGLANVDNTADTAKSIATTQLTGTLTIAQLPAGSVVYQIITNVNYNSTARPTARTDILVHWVGSDATHAPVNALTNDLWDHV